MPVIGTPRIFHKKFKFIVEVDGFASQQIAFQSVSELSMEAAKVEHFEGGVIIPDKTPGRVTFTDVTMERGATSDADLFNWFIEVANAAANTGLLENRFKRDVDIVQLGRSGASLVRWRLFSAWPMKYVAGDWDNTADENVIESVTLTYDFFERIATAGQILQLATP